jgi:RimJ/RimL family protein N-acetyltransferase
MVFFISKKGRKIEIRKIQENDWVGLRNLMNSLVKENAFILRDVPISKEEQIKNLKKRIEDMKKKKRVDLVAIYNGKLVANIYIRRKKFKEKHVGTLGVFVKKNYRNEGIGKALIKEALKHSKKIGIKLVVLGVFKVNKPAMILYKKLGFKKYGELPKALKHKGRYMNNVLMYKRLG